MVVWIFIGILIPIVSIWVHRHTYLTRIRETDGVIMPDIKHKAPFPKWLYAIFIIMGIVPILNIIFFCMGTIIYILMLIGGDVILIGAPKPINRIIKKLYSI